MLPSIKLLNLNIKWHVDALRLSDVESIEGLGVKYVALLHIKYYSLLFFEKRDHMIVCYTGWLLYRAPQFVVLKQLSIYVAV